ncbi:phospholipase D-like domain-containing protein [Tropicimonas isoalkanivorans]|uniref:Phospholipase D n=1 Tax=Tropicimonas isoalkanivorans TaxID=441112 RepID=A0A1I1P1P5_9RHOB|nr:phospholipase D-like domain-containing protein [Tropicimonas isoalkanivorans]SFD03596.1 phospholipase D1/2 [Tropicimonas isoalkanivorans]
MLLLTASEAFPQLERLVLGAKKRVVAGFRIFDADTRLHSEEGQAIGETWADLIAHRLREGISFEFTLADFDPVHRPALHHLAQESAEKLRAAARASGAEERFKLACVRHPAQSSLWHRILFAPLEWREIAKQARRLNQLAESARDQYLDSVPGLAAMLHRKPNGKVRVRRRLPPMYPGSHHQKLAVIDREYLYIGGIDLNERRYDDPTHDRAGGETWHDVQLCLTGEVAGSAEDHLRAFQDECTGRVPPSPRPGLLRTLSCVRPKLAPMIGPRPVVHEIFDRHLEEIGRAEQLIYLESQFLRYLPIAEALAKRAEEVPDLGLIVILPAAPEDIAFDGNQALDARFGEELQARCLARIRKSFGARACLISPAQPRGVPPDGDRATLMSAPLVYVHAKVSLFDDRCAIVSSANLNGRSMKWDTEVGVALTVPEQVTAIRKRVMEHWLPDVPDPGLLDPATAPAAWTALAHMNAKTAPAERQGFLLPFPESAPRRFGTFVPFAPPEMV